jgi:tetratricopeptide (TPR) repeat protein
MEQPAAADPQFRTAIARSRAVIEAMRGNFDQARALVEEAKATAREFGLEGHYAAGLSTSGIIALLEGDLGTAEREEGEAVRIYRTMGDLGHLSSYAPALAEALYAQGRYDEALLLTEEAELASIENDLDAQVNWRRVRGKVLARRGQLDEAMRLATEAVDLARRTDDLDKRGRVLMDLAEVLRLAGRSQESVPILHEAVDTFERKGNVVMTKAARGLLRGDNTAP